MLGQSGLLVLLFHVAFNCLFSGMAFTIIALSWVGASGAV